jgi:hypothetical protein
MSPVSLSGKEGFFYDHPLMKAVKLLLFLCLLSLSIIQPSLEAARRSASSQPFVTASLAGQLGNQCFILAAAVSLALDNGALAVFPDLSSKTSYGIPLNHQKIFHRLHSYPLPEKMVKYHYHEPRFPYAPIPYQPDMKLHGYFQSEQYFREHKDEILALFAPSEQIKSHLEMYYSTILEHPCSVAIHMRSYLAEDPQQRYYPNYARKYYERAASFFPEDALFVVFSNDMPRCKSLLKGLAKEMLFIEGEPYYHDFYLMSMCKHQIIANSTFSWWAAYLNPNPDKLVIAPQLWGYKFNAKDLIPPEWTVLNAN